MLFHNNFVFLFLFMISPIMATDKQLNQNYERHLITELPNEITHHILSYLDEDNLLHAASVLNKHFFYVVTGVDINNPKANPKDAILYKQGGIKKFNLESFNPRYDYKHLKKTFNEPAPSQYMPIPKHIWHNISQIYNLHPTWWPFLKNSKVLKVGIENIHLNEDMIKLGENLYNSSVTHINFANNKIGDQGAILFSTTLKSTRVKSFRLDATNLTETGAAMVLKLLSDTNVTKLDLSSNMFHTPQMQLVTHFLPSSKIRYLSLSSNTISKEGLELLGNNLKQTKLETLNLFGTHLSLEGVKILSQHLKNSSLKRLSFANNDLNDMETITCLFRELENSKIKILNLSLTKINENLLNTIGKNVSSTPIECLILNGNNITTDQASHFLKSIKDSKIKNLKLAFNKIGNSNLDEFAKKLKNSPLEEIDLRMNNLNFYDLKVIARTLKDSNIKSILFGDMDNSIDDNELEELKSLNPYCSWVLKSTANFQPNPFKF